MVPNKFLTAKLKYAPQYGDDAVKLGTSTAGNL